MARKVVWSRRGLSPSRSGERTPSKTEARRTRSSNVMKALSKLRINSAMTVMASILLLYVSLYGVQPLPDSISDAEFWKLVESISEPAGAFISDNLISNEVGYGAALPVLR